MSELVHTLLQQHRTMLDRLERQEADDVFVDDVLALLDDLRLAGEVVPDPDDRAQLRALVRFWSSTVFDYTGSYPTITLLPADMGAGAAPQEAPRRSPPPLLWLLVGGASVAVIAAALTIIGWATSPQSDTTTPLPAGGVPRVRHVSAEQGLGSGAVATLGTTFFCQGTSDLAFHFGLTGAASDSELRWNLSREGTEVVTRPAVLYGESNESLTTIIGSAETGGLVPGNYDLSLISDGEVIWVESFQVLGIAPRAYGIAISDVPAPLDDTGQQSFAAGPRVLFLNYSYEGLCSGLELAHELFLNGDPVQIVRQVWQGHPEGEAQVIFQAAGADAFAPGEYEVSVSISGEEQGRAAFAIGP